MASRDPKTLLPRLFEAPSDAPAARELLEQRILAAYDSARAPRRSSRRLPIRWVALACAAASGAALAMSVQTQYAVEVGKHVVLRVPGQEQADGAAPLIGQLAREGGARVFDIWVRRRATEAGAVLEADIWGDRLPGDEAMARQLQERIPGATVEVHALAGPVRASLGRRVASALLRQAATDEERAAARAALIEQLKQEHGPGHQYQVDIRDQDGRHEVRVKVLKKQGEDKGAHPAP